VVKDVPAGVAVVGIPARVVQPRSSCTDFDAYGIPGRELPDPVARAIDGLLDQISRLQARVGALEAELQNGAAMNGAPHFNGDLTLPDETRSAARDDAAGRISAE
jgi:serine O-acetyltransferase